jgi:hypothetical protein
MRKKKAKSGDEQLIHDETQDWVERSSALSRLAADRRQDFESVARAWLRGEDPELASEALGMLLTYWFDSPRVHEYVATAMQWLETAEDSFMRFSTANNLAHHLQLRSLEQRQEADGEILGALLHALENDEDDEVREICYEALLRRVAPEEAKTFPRFARERLSHKLDVRWDLLEPLRARFRDEN